MTANQYTFLGILQGANNATGQLFSAVLVLMLYFLLYSVIKQRIADIRNSALIVCTIMLVLNLFLFWLSFISQATITISIVAFTASIIFALWRGDSN
jgi:cytochrome c biogenesis factor